VLTRKRDKSGCDPKWHRNAIAGRLTARAGRWAGQFGKTLGPRAKAIESSPGGAPINLDNLAQSVRVLADYADCPNLLTVRVRFPRFGGRSIQGAVAKWLRQRIANPPSSVQLRPAPLGMRIGTHSRNDATRRFHVERPPGRVGFRPACREFPCCRRACRWGSRSDRA
jgi:hypothetical protein